MKLLRYPTVVSEPGLCVDVICTSRTQRSCGRGYILLGNVAIIQKKILRVTKINLGDASNERERERECIFIPLKIAKRKRYKNAVDGVVPMAI